MVAPQRETRRKEQRTEMIPNREREKGEDTNEDSKTPQYITLKTR